ncbi:MAG: ribonuclease J [bacterium]
MVRKSNQRSASRRKSSGNRKRHTSRQTQKSNKQQSRNSHQRYKTLIDHRSRDGKAKLRVIPLGGWEEVGRNMMLVEYNRDIIIVDMGLQFPEEDQLGIDYLIPNISYLKGKEKYVRGVVITHGHYDHIGAIPHLMEKIGNPTIFTMPLTRAIIEKRQEEYKGKAPLNIYTISEDDEIKLGSFSLEFFRVNHNIPDSMGVIINTPEGRIVHTGDFKFDHAPVNDEPANIAKMARVGGKGVLLLCADSTNAAQEGYQVSESTIQKTLHKVIAEAHGRVIVSTFASLLTRAQQIINIAENTGRKVVIEGHSLKTNVDIAKEIGYLKMDKKTIVSIKQADDLPDNKVIILCTGAQAEERAVLMRIANKEHKDIEVEPGDTVIFSSSVVPGNERSVQKLKDTLLRQGAVLFHKDMLDVHTSGHARQEDLRFLISLIKPKYHMPIYGNHFLLRAHADVALNTGIDRNHIFVCDNGSVLEFVGGEGKMSKETVMAEAVMVDGLGVGDISNVVLRDRKMMSEDGMIVVIATVERKTGKLLNSPDIISRGFIYMKGSKGLVEQTRKRVKQILVDKDPTSSANETYLKKKLQSDLGKFLFQKTERRPMILPVIIQV